MSPKKAKKDEVVMDEQDLVDTHEAEMLEEEKSLDQAEAQLVEQIKQAEEKASEHWEMLLRTKAEMDNLRKRTQKDLENAHKYGLEKFVSELLPVIDSMELGLAAEDVTIESLSEGMKLTLDMACQMFEKFNIEVIDPIQQQFDPEFHQAMSIQPADDVEPNTVIAVMQKGYTLNGRLVRPAMVVVSRAAEDQAED